MPLINILFWLMLLLTAYMTLSLLSAYYKAEREAQRQLARLQTVHSRSASAAFSESGKTSGCVTPRSSNASRQAKVSSRAGEEQMFVRPASRSCRFQQVAMDRQQEDTTDLSFDWMRSAQKSMLTRQTISSKPCQQDHQNNHNCA